ncbi:MAG: hypothetical protein WAT92_00310 [Saprospiraceae bacterium]
MKVVNLLTNKEHNIDQKTFDSWTGVGARLKVIEVTKPTAIVTKEKELEVKEPKV